MHTHGDVYAHPLADLCNCLALVAKRLCTEHVNPDGVAPLLASRLITIDKCPGVRPIGVGETSRRIIGKAVLTALKEDILDATGTSQLCAGQDGGSEAAIHAMRRMSLPRQFCLWMHQMLSIT